MRWVRSLITKHWVPPLLLPQSPQVDGWSADRCQDLCAFAMGNTSNPWCPRLMQFLVNGESWQVIYQSGGLVLVSIRDRNPGFVLVSAIPKWHSHGPVEPERTLKINLSQTFLSQMSFWVCSSSHSKTSDRAEAGTWFSWLQARGSSPSPPASTYLEINLIAAGKSPQQGILFSVWKNWGRK